MAISFPIHAPASSTPAQRHTRNFGRSRKRLALEADVRQIRTQCRGVYRALFSGERMAGSGVGFTSPLGGEGKTFAALTAASVLASDFAASVTYVECNWERPSLADRFQLDPTPGLAEWLRQECDLTSIRYQVAPDLAIIPAGDGLRDGAKLCRALRDTHAMAELCAAGSVVVAELPATLSCPYGRLAATLVDSLIVVARWGETSEQLLAETCAQLEDLNVVGILLNRERSRIPSWLRRML
jgi:Mrp family chromosome partitioning ATPase